MSKSSVIDYTNICRYHMGIVDETIWRRLEAEGHTFQKEPELFFETCRRMHSGCTRSHDRESCINYFYTHPEAWFEFAWISVSRLGTPRKHLYKLYRPIITHNPDFQREINRNSIRPCYSAIDGRPCRNPSCRYVHKREDIERYYLYHPDVYVDDLTYKLSDIAKNMRDPRLDEKVNVERQIYLRMIKQFEKINIKPSHITRHIIREKQSPPSSEEDRKHQVMKWYDEKLQPIINRITDATLVDHVEETCSFLDDTEKSDILTVVRLMCNECAMKASRESKYTSLYNHYMSAIINSTAVNEYREEFVQTMIDSCEQMFSKAFDSFVGVPVDHEFPDDNLPQKETARLIRFMILFDKVPPIKEKGHEIIMKIIGDSKSDQCLIELPYVICIPEALKYISKDQLNEILKNATALPPSRYRSRLRFSIMDILDGRPLSI